MNPDEKEILQKTYKLTEDNNRILRAMRRSMVWAGIFRTLYWIFIIGAAVGVYYYLQPYIGEFQKLFASFTSNIEAINKVFNSVPR